MNAQIKAPETLGQLLRRLQQDGEVTKGPEQFSVFARLSLSQWYCRNEPHWMSEALSERLADTLERAYLQGNGADAHYLGNLTAMAVELYAIDCCKRSPAWAELSVEDDSDDPNTFNFKQEMAQIIYEQAAEQRLIDSLRAWDMNNPR